MVKKELKSEATGLSAARCSMQENIGKICVLISEEKDTLAEAEEAARISREKIVEYQAIVRDEETKIFDIDKVVEAGSEISPIDLESVRSVVASKVLANKPEPINGLDAQQKPYTARR